MIGSLVLVGEAPGRESIAARPALTLTGSSGRNLCAIAGWDWVTYLRRTERHNLFYDPMPRWPAKLAWSRARELELALEGRTVILLGQKVAAAFDYADDEPYRWLTSDLMNVAKVPHPSGRNRAWNDPAERTRARAFLEGLL